MALEEVSRGFQPPQSSERSNLDAEHCQEDATFCDMYLARTVVSCSVRNVKTGGALRSVSQGLRHAYQPPVGVRCCGWGAVGNSHCASPEV